MLGCIAILEGGASDNRTTNYERSVHDGTTTVLLPSIVSSGYSAREHDTSSGDVRRDGASSGPDVVDAEPPEASGGYSDHEVLPSSEAISQADRRSCEEIVGTAYHSLGEQTWFLENCRSTPVRVASGSGNTGGTSNGSQEPRQEPMVRVEQLDASIVYGGATHYCNPQPDGRCTDSTGTNYEGSKLGCPAITLPAGRGDSLYHSSDRQIAAVPPSRYSTWPCGTPLQVCGVIGCIRVIRMDACPGCDASGVIIDLSEAGIAAVCGQGAGRCPVSVRLSN